MVVMQVSADKVCPMASQNPAKTNQITLPMNPAAPVPRSPLPVSTFRSIALLPNGRRVKVPIVKQARPYGIPTMDTKARIPAIHHRSAIKPPPIKIHSRFPLPSRVLTSLCRFSYILLICSERVPRPLTLLLDSCRQSSC